MKFPVLLLCLFFAAFLNEVSLIAQDNFLDVEWIINDNSKEEPSKYEQRFIKRAEKQKAKKQRKALKELDGFVDYFTSIGDLDIYMALDADFLSRMTAGKAPSDTYTYRSIALGFLKNEQLTMVKLDTKEFPEVQFKSAEIFDEMIYVLFTSIGKKGKVTLYQQPVNLETFEKGEVVAMNSVPFSVLGGWGGPFVHNPDEVNTMENFRLVRKDNYLYEYSYTKVLNDEPDTIRIVRYNKNLEKVNTYNIRVGDPGKSISFLWNFHVSDDHGIYMIIQNVIAGPKMYGFERYRVKDKKTKKKVANYTMDLIVINNDQIKRIPLGLPNNLDVDKVNIQTEYNSLLLFGICNDVNLSRTKEKFFCKNYSHETLEPISSRFIDLGEYNMPHIMNSIATDMEGNYTFVLDESSKVDYTIRIPVYKDSTGYDNIVYRVNRTTNISSTVLKYGKIKILKFSPELDHLWTTEIDRIQNASSRSLFSSTSSYIFQEDSDLFVFFNNELPDNENIKYEIAGYKIDYNGNASKKNLPSTKDGVDILLLPQQCSHIWRSSKSVLAFRHLKHSNFKEGEEFFGTIRW